VVLPEHTNCWIGRDGQVWPVAKASHAIDYGAHGRHRGYCIRVSLPEHRRTWAGIETRGKTTPEARVACQRIIRELRRAGLQIVADIHGETIEVLPHDRPTALNRSLNR